MLRGHQANLRRHPPAGAGGSDVRDSRSGCYRQSTAPYLALAAVLRVVAESPTVRWARRYHLQSQPLIVRACPKTEHSAALFTHKFGVASPL